MQLITKNALSYLTRLEFQRKKKGFTRLHFRILIFKTNDSTGVYLTGVQW